MVIKSLKVASDIWRAENAFDAGRFEEAYRAYKAVSGELRRRNKSSFDVVLKAAMSAHNAGMIDCASEAYLEAHNDVSMAGFLSGDNRNYLLNFIERWMANIGGGQLTQVDRVFDRNKVKKRWLGEFPIDQ